MNSKFKNMGPMSTRKRSRSKDLYLKTTDKVVEIVIIVSLINISLHILKNIIEKQF